MSNGYTYTQGDILIEPYRFQKIIKLKIIRELNEHARLYISGIIDDESADKYVETADSESSIKISLKDNNGTVISVFEGIITNIGINTVNNVRTLKIEALSRTFLLDIKRKNRTFQNENYTYKNVFSEVIKEYNDVQILNYITNQTKIDKLIVQYNETDWEFLKRLASHFNVPLVPESTLSGIKYFMGNSGCSTLYELDEFNYSIKKGLQEYKLKCENDIDDLNDVNLISYEVITNIVMKLYNLVNFKGRSLYIYRTELELINGVISNKYILRDENGMKVRRIYNNKIVGVSLIGSVIDTEKDKVKVSLEIDRNSTQYKGEKWFEYSTVFSSPDGTGWYCMPEIGDAIRLYFPDNVENNAYAISSVNLQSSNSSKRSDPSRKSIGTKYGKEIVMSPGAVEIIGNGNLLMRLTDDGGIEVNSDKSIVMSAGGDVSISGGGKVTIQGDAGINLTQAGANMTIQDDVTMSGGKVNIQS
ncbi:phage tail protein [Clostridium botulinum]|uniref:Phage tail protein n=1 Tax=Clostridium botulinum TaxID=1491 RepID=A0A6M0V7L1_CLOBO|nr:MULTISPECIES: contractile injection system protein, VgrG/Pvc8 family [Clostridium]MBN1055188.1 phage tail protein [Clostridium botulinum]MCS6109501.1 phage tail protein [Clostridium botulinum]NFE11787.1 phage tail protein [Clostridium botulinum]NFE58399.1 phage tail protein [Clostridium botulinum]NFF88816.1 phage tail protein [Clostridium botulinum]